MQAYCCIAFNPVPIYLIHICCIVQQVSRPITKDNCLYTEHVDTFFTAHKQMGIERQPSVYTQVTMAADDYRELSRRLPYEAEQLVVFPFHQGMHYSLVGVVDSTIYWLDPLQNMPDVELVLDIARCATLRNTLNVQQSGFITGVAAWRALTGLTDQMPQFQDDMFQCGVFVCMYLWEILHKQKWTSSVAKFREYVRGVLNAPSH